MDIHGRISFQDLEGGFWGILGGNGEKYLPVDGVPEEYRKDGLHIRARIETVHMVGTSMWGQYVKLLAISRDDRS